MQKAFFILLTNMVVTVLFLSCRTSGKEKDCSQFKSGEFLYHGRGQQRDIFYSINRNDSFQTETNQQTGDITKLTIKWTDKCKYELKFTESTARFPDSIQKIRESMLIKNEIISWTQDYYIFKAKDDNYDFVLTDTLWLKK